MDLKEQRLLGGNLEKHWYYVSKGRALRALLAGVHARELLDVGAGSGIFSRQLLDAGVADSAVCIDPGYDQEWTELRNGHRMQFVRSAGSASGELVLLMDVLEHVDDDVELLREYTRNLPPGGRVIMSVPAFQFLWSPHDEFLEHRRRYTRSLLESVVRSAGLEVRCSRYFFGLLLPAVALERWLERLRLWAVRGEPATALRRYPAWLNAALIRIHDIERSLLFPRNRAGGLTIFCVATRP